MPAFGPTNMHEAAVLDWGRNGYAGGNPDSNTLISETATVICLDDYHSNDRFGRRETGRTALDPKEQDFDTMYEQTKALKEGKAVDKLIYNHVTGLLDPAETVQPPKVCFHCICAIVPASILQWCGLIAFLQL